MLNKSKSAEKHFLAAVTTKNLQMFRFDNESRSLKVSVEIVEHLNRLLEISDNCHFYFDEDAFEAFGSSGFPQRFTRVFVKPEHFNSFKRGKFYRVHRIDELKNTIEAKDFFSPEIKVFFIGNSDFLKRSAEFANKLLLTVVDAEITESENSNYRFPLNEMKKIFHKRRDIQPEMLEMIKKFRKNKKRQNEERFEIADNGMKIYKQPVEETKLYDSLIDTPDYMFYEYAR